MSRSAVLLRFAALGISCVLGACGGGDDGGADAAAVGDGVADGPCAHDDYVGWFEAALQAQFTSVQGQIEDRVTPFRVPTAVDTDGACTFFRPPTLFCDPACAVGTTCAPDNMCVAQPAAVSAGTVSVSGMKGDVEMNANPPVFFYTNTGTLEHPGFDEGDHLVLVAAGDADGLAPFALDAYGVAQLDVPAESVALQAGTTIDLSWASPEVAGSEVLLNLNIAQHGGNPGWIECIVPDTGSFAMPVTLTDQLLASGYSGFPSLVVTRRSIDSIDTVVGCVQWSAQSTEILAVEIDGLTSCSGDEDCTPPETCQPDLTCG